MVEVGELDGAETLAGAETCLLTIMQAEADELALAAHWADLHHPDSLPPAQTEIEARRRRHCGDYGIEPGGQGTPPVLASCPAELGLVLRTSSGAAKHLIADALDLRHRLPLLWTEVREGRVRAWRARKVTQATRQLPLAVMAEVDTGLQGLLSSLPWCRFEAVLDATVRRADPVGAAYAEAEAASRRFVALGRERTHGLCTLIARGEVLDLLTMMAAVNRIAAILAVEGDADTLDVRCSKAIGILAQPDRALALLNAHADDEDVPPAPVEPDRCRRWTPSRSAGSAQSGEEPDDEEPDDEGPDDAVPPEPAEAQETDKPEPVDDADAEPEPEAELGAPGSRSLVLGRTEASGSRPVTTRVQLYVHLTDAALGGTDPRAVCRVEGVGPITVGTLRRWLQRPDAAVTVRPVVVPGDAVPVDAYEIPQAVREAVRLRQPASSYPWSWCTDRAAIQLDHVTPYLTMARGGPPGQTDPYKLAPAVGTEHQRKTSRRWGLRMPYPGVCLWRSPHGWITLVINQGTFPSAPTPRRGPCGTPWRPGRPRRPVLRTSPDVAGRPLT